MKKKEATGAVGYMLLFGIAIIMVILTMYMMQVSKLMTYQHEIDDALADSTLSALVADDVYYFRTYESTGTPVVRYRNVSEAHNNYVECMTAAVANTKDFYYNFVYEKLILYEVEAGQVKVTTYTGNAGVKTITYGAVGVVRTPQGKAVTETSTYAQVSFDIKSILDGTYINKARDIYCTLEVN